MIKRPEEGRAVNRRKPSGDRRFFFHPVHRHFGFDPMEMTCGASALLQKPPERLHVVMMNAATTDAKPLAFDGFHQVQGNVSVLKMFLGFDGLQIGAAENESIRAK